MLAKYRDVRPKKDVKSPLKMFSYVQRIKNFFQGGGIKFWHIFKCISGRIILKHIENKKGFRWVQGHAFLEIFLKFTYSSAILVLFEHLGKFCLRFLPLNLSVSPNIMHFVRAFLIMRF